MSLNISPLTESRGRVDVAAIPLLDHGYIKPKFVYGDEEGIVEGARQSTGKGFLGWGPIPKLVPSKLPSGGTTFEMVAGDEKLLKFLYDNRHDTPFEQAGVIFEVQLPIFVVREWHRHRTQSYNEMSARYTPLPDLAYVPTIERIMLNSQIRQNNKQLQGTGAELTKAQAKAWQKRLIKELAQSQDFYSYGLDMGIPKELARIDLPVGRYTRMWASANLRNWLAFMTLRCAPAAQWEIRQYALTMASILDVYFPRTLGLFRERFGIA